MALIEEALTRLRAECQREGRAEEFDALSGHLTQGSPQYAVVARALGLTPKDVASRVFAYRSRLRALIQAQIRESVTTDAEFQEEMKAIFSIF